MTEHQGSRDRVMADSLLGSISVGIITIRDDEFKAVLDHFPQRQRVPGKSRFYEYAKLVSNQGTDVRVCIARSPEQGQGPAQALAHDMIAELGPVWILLVGIGGGVPDAEFSLGDVILSNRVNDFTISAALEGGAVEFQQQGGPVHKDVERLLTHLPAMDNALVGWNSFETLGAFRPTEIVPKEPDERYYGDEAWQKKTFRSISRNFAVARAPIFKASPIITANTLVKDTALADQWRTSARHAAAIEMELGGIFTAARYGGSGDTRVLAIRGLSDIVGYNRNHEWTLFACKTAASLAHGLIKAGFFDEPPPRSLSIPPTESASRSSPFMNVPPRLGIFVGRSAEIEAIDAALASAKPAVLTPIKTSPVTPSERAAVHGLGGVGKTSLAVEFAHRHCEKFGGIYWCPAETRIGLLTSLAKLGTLLGSDVAQANLEQAAKVALNEVARQSPPWLLIYDNVKEPQDIVDLLPRAGVKTIITSRYFDWVSWATEIPVDVLPLDEAVEFLNHRADRHDVEGAKELAVALGELPLALDHAAASCRRTGLSFKEYSSNAARRIESGTNYDLHSSSVRATFEIAVSNAATKCPEVELLIAFLAQCAPERIPKPLVSGAIEDATKCENAIAALAEASLIKHDPFESGHPAITVHRLVQAVSRAQSNAAGQSHLVTRRLIEQLSELYPITGYQDPKCWEVCSELTPHVLHLFQNETPFATTLRQWPHLLNSTASYLQGRSEFSAAAPLFKRALDIRSQSLGRHPLTANSHANYANLLSDQGDTAGAEHHAEQACAISEETLGPNDLQVALHLTNFAAMIQEDKPEEAKVLFERALAIREHVFGPFDPQTANSLRHLGQLLVKQNELSAARPLIVRAVEIWERHPVSLFTAMGWGAMATLLKHEGDFETAEIFYRKALDIWEHESPNATVTNVIRLALAALMLKAGRPSESEKLAQKALAELHRLVGPGRSTVKAAGITAEALEMLGRTAEAHAIRNQYALVSK